jgi:Cu(I)/Ag(I) efflux system membrane fusion protein
MKFSLKTLLRFTVLALTLTIGAFPLISCKKGGANAKPADVDYYTCTMHPSVKSQDPNAKCPICSMDLVPVKKKGGSEAAGQDHGQAKGDAKGMGMSEEEHAKMSGGKGKEDMKEMKGMPGMPGMPGMQGGAEKEGVKEEEPSEFMVAVSRQQQIGVTYSIATNKPLQLSVRTVGNVTFDRIRHWDIVTRVDGYVDKLFVSSKGELVDKDKSVVTVYSPDLLTTQREFLDLLQARDEAKTAAAMGVGENFSKLIEAAKGRLRLWNITDTQIQELERERKPNVYVTLFAPVRGLVQNIQVNQGQKVMSGDRLVTVDDLSLVWVWAQFYQEELPLLKQGQEVSVTTSAYPDQKFIGKIAVIDPFVNPATRVVSVRVDIENPDFKLRPDMYVDISLSLHMGEGLTIPFSAVIPTGDHNIVFVDKGEGKLQPRFVELGRKFGDDYQVRSGLKEGDRVVASANFLIDAEAKVQGALKSF